MRRPLALAFAAALVVTVPAAAGLEPVRRTFGEVHVPRVQTGTITIPRAQARGRITVVVRLQQPPLAQYRRTLAAVTASRRLNVGSASSRAHLARLAAAQRAAVARLRRTIPEASVFRRYRIVLNGLAVELPARRLPDLVRQPFAEQVYPSLRYRQTTNRSPFLIGAQEFWRLAGARGEGIKIAVVDDGVDERNPYFDPTGFSYPAGYPRGGTRWTTPKVIVARAFPGPNSGRQGRLPVVPRISFHGTHVAGIAAGVEGTRSNGGQDHPPTAGLTGVAPRAYIGNYRVFNVPTPIGHNANSPEIVAAFEAAVADGMDVINFSGGGAETEPLNDVLNEAVRNVAAAGVVPVISAGNDRDEFGLGSAGSPGTAQEAISVAAVSNAQVFSAAVRVTAAGAPDPLRQIPSQRARGDVPAAWTSSDQQLVDVGSMRGSDGRPVDPLLCGPPGNRDAGPSNLPPRSLQGVIALASRGTCTFVSKAARARAAGAIGLILVDNRPGEANPIPVRMPVPGGMISDLDGRRLREFMATTGGRTTIRLDRGPLRIETGRGGTVTAFSSAGPTPFVRRLKPDVAAPGGQILSATLPPGGGPFAVFDGTSMSAPHVAGAAALLVQRHREWSPRQVKSALVSTAGPAYLDTARTVEAPVILAGGGLASIPHADDPKLFTDPVSVITEDLNVNSGARSSARLVRIFDARDGAGTWQVELRPQSATSGAAVQLPPAITLAPGDDTELPVVFRAAADAIAGDNYGFIVLRRGDVTRRIPYFFAVTRPALESLPATRLQTFQSGDTSRGVSRVDRYRYPDAPFGPPPDYFGPPMHQPGAEKLYSIRLNEPVANFGVSVPVSSDGSRIDPWVLGSKDENDVQGYAGTPVNVNALTFDYRLDIGAAGLALPRPRTYYVSVDSGDNPFTGRSLAGRYVLQSWVNDVLPPLIFPITTRVSAGRPTIVARVIDVGRSVADPGSGVDPLSLVIGYGRALVGAALYDPLSGIAIFPLPGDAPTLAAGRRSLIVRASDYQEAKNVASLSDELLPNTSFRRVALRVVAGPTVTWLSPGARQCVGGRVGLVVAAGSSSRVRAVRFFDGARRIGVDTRGGGGLYATRWQTKGVRRGTHVLRAVAVDAKGRVATATRSVRVCR